jgi:hypothetical protein
MEQYVCVRIVRMDDVDIGLFDYDRNNTLYFFILNADEQIYLRYGGRDSKSPDTYLNLPSIELAMKKGLELHEKYKRGELAKTARPKPMSPREFPLLVERTYAKNNCVECHLIGDFQNQHREIDGTLDKLTHLFRSPDIKTIGIHLDVPKGLVVQEAQGAALEAGMKAGDVITAVNGTAVHTFADLQYNYDKTDRKAASVTMQVERDGTARDLTIKLPLRWWLTDLRFRQSTIEPRTYFDARPLTAEEKRKLELPDNSFASEVTHVDMFAQTLKTHELRPGDIIVAVDGVGSDDAAHTADLYIKLRKKAGDSVTLDVIRDGKRIKSPLKTFRMSFRK